MYKLICQFVQAILMEVHVPVVDFSAYGLGRDEPDEERFQDLIDDIDGALKTVGCLYLNEHGIPGEKVQYAIHNSLPLPRGGGGGGEKEKQRNRPSNRTFIFSVIFFLYSPFQNNTTRLKSIISNCLWIYIYHVDIMTVSLFICLYIGILGLFCLLHWSVRRASKFGQCQKLNDAKLHQYLKFSMMFCLDGFLQ